MSTYLPGQFYKKVHFSSPYETLSPYCQQLCLCILHSDPFLCKSMEWFCGPGLLMAHSVTLAQSLQRMLPNLR